MMNKVTYNFSWEKNCQLISNRQISFEEVISAIEDNCVLDVLKHPNDEKYCNQQIYIVEFNNYAYLVPFVIQGADEIFLKTVIPSRKATRKYLTLNRAKNEKKS